MAAAEGVGSALMGAPGVVGAFTGPAAGGAFAAVGVLISGAPTGALGGAGTGARRAIGDGSGVRALATGTSALLVREVARSAICLAISS